MLFLRLRRLIRDQPIKQSEIERGNRDDAGDLLEADRLAFYLAIVFPHERLRPAVVIREHFGRDVGLTWLESALAHEIVKRLAKQFDFRPRRTNDARQGIGEPMMFFRDVAACEPDQGLIALI